MESKQIGGGLLATVAIVAPWAGQAMGLTLPQPVGFALLALCVVIAMLGFALVLSPSTKERVAREAEAARDAAAARAAVNDRRVTIARMAIAHANSIEMGKRGLSQARCDGIELPPDSEINHQLERMGEDFRVTTRGHQFWCHDA